VRLRAASDLPRSLRMSIGPKGSVGAAETRAPRRTQVRRERVPGGYARLARTAPRRSRLLARL